MNMQPAFVRPDMVAPMAPPRVVGGVFGWMHERLFSSVANSILTIISAILLVLLAWPTARFLLVDAVWMGSSRVDCLPETAGRPIGACWPFVAARHPAGVGEPLGAAGDPHVEHCLHRVLAGGTADHGAVLRDLHAALVPAGELEDRRARPRAHRHRAVLGGLSRRGRARRLAGDPARSIRGRDGARLGLLAHDGF